VFFALFLFLPLSFSFSFFSLNLETKTPNRVVGRKVEFLDSEAVRVGLESGLERCFFRERERKVSCCRVLSFSVSSLFSQPPHPSHQTRELQDRADNGDEHPEDGETEGDGTAQGGQVAAVHSVGGRRGGARRRLRFHRCAGLLLREHAAVDAVFACEGRRRVLKGRPETRVGAEKGEEGAAGGTEGERPRK